MTTTATDKEFATAFAPLLEVQQRGEFRPATPNDVLELLAPRYVLKGHGGYLAEHGKGWTTRQREAIQIPDRDYAYEARAQGLKQNGVATKVVRLRRRGTCGLEAVRMRPGLKITQEDGVIGLGVSADEAMMMMAALTGAKREDAEQ